ncbi:DUF6879 family protein [Catellatospora paridis]|uniref:DUF6879 family protein n=1 Tax=Catellatospora paridis TaxID=1617086 RepID=UPI0012D4406B|nr:DUF6879 family protein [Catellatospora paridis]
MAEQPTFVDLLAACQFSAVHLEMRDGYMLDDPNYIAWSNGDRPVPGSRPEQFHRWYEMVGDVVSRGGVVRRARVVSEPISDYVRFEYDTTEVCNITAGELVRWLPRKRASDLPLPGNDFWLFDDDIVLFNHFDGNGNGTFRDTSTDPAVIELCRSAFEAVWQRAIPHRDYRPT